MTQVLLGFKLYQNKDMGIILGKVKTLETSFRCHTARDPAHRGITVTFNSLINILSYVFHLLGQVNKQPHTSHHYRTVRMLQTIIKQILLN